MSTASTPGGPGDPGAATSGGAGASGGQSGGMKDEAKEAAGTAKEESRHVADVAKGEARHVVDESRQQARSLLDDALSQVDEQSRQQRDRMVTTLRTFGDDLDKMANGEQAGGGMAQDVARQVADRARELSSRMDGREPTELLDEVRSFARRKPGTFLLGALAAGVVAGRLARGARDAQSQGGGTTGTPAYDDVRGTATGAPTAGVGSPEAPPAYPAGSGVGGATADQSLTAPTGTPGAAPADTPWSDEPGRRGTV
jgi:vacuolar-type H+-ATPase subunit H